MNCLDCNCNKFLVAKLAFEELPLLLRFKRRFYCYRCRQEYEANAFVITREVWRFYWQNVQLPGRQAIVAFAAVAALSCGVIGSVAQVVTPRTANRVVSAQPLLPAPPPVAVARLAALPDPPAVEAVTVPEPPKPVHRKAVRVKAIRTRKKH